MIYKARKVLFRLHHFYNHATKMTLQSFLSTKDSFRPESVFSCTGISIKVGLYRTRPRTRFAALVLVKQTKVVFRVCGHVMYKRL